MADNFAHVAIASVAASTQSSQVLVDQTWVDDGYHVVYMDLRTWLTPRAQGTPCQQEDNGLTLSVQKSVFQNKHFAQTMEQLVDELCSAGLQSRHIVVILESSSNKRAQVVAQLLMELLNSLKDDKGRHFNATHFPLANLEKDDLTTAITDIEAWAATPWNIAEPPPTKQDRFGWRAVQNNSEANANYKKVWGYIKAINGDCTESDDEVVCFIVV
jgi:hypothetical protein